MGKFLLRWLAAFVLVAATFNPTPWNYLGWLASGGAQHLALAVLLGLVLFGGYAFSIAATFKSMGSFGVGLVVAIFAALVWVLHDAGWLSLANSALNLWLGLLALSLVLGLGMSWGFIQRAVTGRVEVDEPER